MPTAIAHVDYKQWPAAKRYDKDIIESEGDRKAEVVGGERENQRQAILITKASFSEVATLHFLRCICIEM